MLATSPDRGRLVVGGVLILVGAVFLVGQVFDVRVEEYGWPLLVLVPGLAILVIGLLVGGPGGVALSIVGGITTMTGVVLGYQAVTDQWATWAYAWALVAPGGVGLGMFLSGLVQGDRELADSGGRVALVGVGLFVGFGLFFEGVIGLTTGRGLFEEALVPAALVVIGILVIAYGVLGGRRRSA
jgi:hypothetical protein